MTDTKTAPEASMPPEQPRITATIAGRSLCLVLRPYAAGYFFATLACDLLYFLTQGSSDRRSAAVEFSVITEWLLAAGLLLAVVANVAAFLDFRGERRFRELADLGLYAAGHMLVVVLGLCNFAIRFTDGSDAVMETGLVLSLATVVVLLCIPAQAWNRLYR